MDLSIITVTYNSENTITDQLRSVVLACDGIAYEQIVVDNASTDSTIEKVKGNANIILIENEKNEGFAAANNAAAKIAKGRYLLFLNPDMRLEPHSLGRMIEWMDRHTDIGISSCKLTTEDGLVNKDAGPRRFPTISDQLALIFKVHHVWPGFHDHYLMRDFDPHTEQEVDSVRGSFMLMRRELVEKLGWAFDPRYFIWFEDVDVCQEAKRLGYKVVYTPIVSCVDLVGQSFSTRKLIWRQRQFTKSMLTYFRKWKPRWQRALIWLARPVGFVFVTIAEFFIDDVV